MTAETAYVTDAATAISSQTEDRDGRLFVGPSVLTRAGVDDYVGAEVQGWQALGLDPKRTYRFLRSPDELRSAVPKMNMLPLTMEHVSLSAKDHDQSKVIGSTGSGAVYDNDQNVIRAPLSIWKEPYISRVRSRDQKEISMGYRFRPVMTPGVWNGKPYDGVMTNIEPNHFALVPAGRVNIDSDGPLAAVADAATTGGKALAEDDKKTPPSVKVGDEGESTPSAKNPLDGLVDCLRAFAPDVDDDKLRAAATQLIAMLNAGTPGAEQGDGNVGDEPQTGADREREREGEEARLERERRDRERESAGMKAEAATVGDAALRQSIRTEIMATFRGIDQAKEDVRGVVGQAVMVGDSGGAIYRNALKALGIADADKMGDEEAARTFKIVKANRARDARTGVVGDARPNNNAAATRKALGLEGRFQPTMGI